MKPGDLVTVKILTLAGSKKTIGMIIEYDEDPLDFIPAKVIVQGKIKRVAKERIKLLKRNMHVSKNKK